MADGIFKCSPSLFDQFFVIHGHKDSSTFPLVYSLTPNRTTGTYVRLFQALKSLNSNLAPSTIITDFEQALQNAITAEFSSSEQHGCYFHFLQANIRQMKRSPKV